MKTIHVKYGEAFDAIDKFVTEHPGVLCLEWTLPWAGYNEPRTFCRARDVDGTLIAEFIVEPRS